MSDKLVEIPKDKWGYLRDLYLSNWPKHHVGYYTVDNFMRWIKYDENITNFKVYSLNGDWTDGTFLIVDRYQLFINTLDDKNLDRLTKALSLLDFKHGIKISSFLERHRPAVLKVIEDKKLENEFDSVTVLYYLPRSESKKFSIDCPPNITLKTLCEADAEMINELWPNRHEGSLFFIKRAINWSANIGAYTNDDELVAWCLRLQSGALGVLQVKESHKRQGLGSLVTKAMAKILSDMDQDCFAFVSEENWPSRLMFEKLGFSAIDNVYFLRTLPTVPFQWKDD